MRMASDVANFRSLGRSCYGLEGEMPRSLQELVALEQEEIEIFEEKRRRYDEAIRLEETCEAVVVNVVRRRSDSTVGDEEEEEQQQQGARKDATEEERQEMDPAEEAHAKKMRLLSATPLCRLLLARQRDEVAEYCEVLEVRSASQVVIKQGREIPALYMLCEGKCTAQITSADGEVLISRSFSPGDWFPETSLVAGQSSPFSVTTTSPTCTFLRLPAGAFRTYLTPHIQEKEWARISLVRDMLGGMTLQDAVRLISVGRLHSVQSGALLVEQGEVAMDLLILLRGQAELSRDGLRLSAVSAPNLLGQVSAVCNLPSPVQATATAASQLLSLPKTDIAHLIKEFSSFKCVASSLVEDAVTSLHWQRQRAGDASLPVMRSDKRDASSADGSEGDHSGLGVAARAGMAKRRQKRPQSAFVQRSKGFVGLGAAPLARSDVDVSPSKLGGGGGLRAAGVENATMREKGRAKGGARSWTTDETLRNLNSFHSSQVTNERLSFVPGHSFHSSQVTHFGEGIFAAPLPRPGEESRPQSAFAYTRLVTRTRTVGKLVRPTTGQRGRLHDSMEQSMRNRPLTAPRNVLGDDQTLAMHINDKSQAKLCSRSIKRNNEAMLNSDYARFYKLSDDYLLHQGRAITRSLLARIQSTTALRMRVTVERSAKREDTMVRDKVAIGTRARRLKLKLEKQIGGFAGGFKLLTDPDDT